MSLDDYTCTCGSPSATFHDDDCKLNDSAEFELGLAWWDVEEQRLVYSSRRSEHQEQLALPTTRTWTELPPLPPRCRHRGDPVVLADGTVVWASGEFERKEDEPLPDLGVYLASAWRPQCIAYFVEWPDFGLPTMNWYRFIELVEIVHREAQSKVVEIGCLGGHGRTGTFLACISVVGGATPTHAIEQMRAAYCDKAIETTRQEWFVEWVHAQLHGIPVRDIPPVPPSKWERKKYDPSDWTREVTDTPPLSDQDFHAQEGWTDEYFE